MVYPFVTVIMPIRNEALYIARSLGAVLEQDYPQEQLEIIVVDGQSSDDTLARIAEVPGANRVIVLSNSRQIQSVGMNCGIRAAQGEFVIRVDGHTVIARNYIHCCVERLMTSGDANVGGCLNPTGVTVMGRAIATASRSHFAVPSAFRISQSARYVDTVYMGAWPRHIFTEVGLFDEQLAVNEDYELNYRIRQSGGRILLAPEVCSTYYGQQKLRGLFVQNWRYGYWKPRVIRKHPASLRARQLAAPLLVAGLGVGLIVGWWLIVLLSFYFLTNVVFSVRAAKHSHPKVNAWRLPLVFATIHLAWGLGFWFGTLTLWRRSPP